MTQESAPTKPTRVLHVFGHLGVGGAELRMLDVFRHIDRRRYRFHFCSLSGQPGSLDEQVGKLGGEVHLVRLDRVGFPRRFRRLLEQYQFDVVHSHPDFFSGFVLRMAAQCATPIRVAHFHALDACRRSGPARTLLRALKRRWIDQHATHILGVSEGVLAKAWGQGWMVDPRCRVVYPALDPSAFDKAVDREEVCRELGLPQDAALVIHVGRMVKEKNHLRLTSIFSDLARRRPTARLLLVGRGDNQIERLLRRQIARLEIGDRVVFCGERLDVPRLLKAADVMVFPSLSEGLPGAVLEACAAGCPVVASDLSGIREISDHLSGVHLLSLDAPGRRWARAVNELLARRPSDDERAAARRRFTTSPFTVDRSAEILRHVWDGQVGPAKIAIRPAA